MSPPQLTTSNPLYRRFGYDSGRIAPRNVSPMFGDYVWCLGSDTPGRIARFGIAEIAGMSQSIDFSGVDLLRLTIQYRVPAIQNGVWFLTTAVTGQPGLVGGLSVLPEPIAESVGRLRTGDTTDVAFPVYRVPGAPYLTTFYLWFIGDGLSDFYDLEVPAFYVEKAEEESASGPFMFGRYPTPNQIGAGRRGPFVGSVADPAMTGWNISTLDVNIGGEYAIQGGILQPGWSASGGSHFATAQSLGSTGPAVDDILTFSVVRDTPFDSESWVSTIIDVDTNGAVNVNELWKCQIEDWITPTLLGATAKDIRVVRVVFDEPVRQLGDGAESDGLTRANYGIVPVPDGEYPVADVVVDSVLTADDDAVDLITDVALSPGRTYRARVQNVADLSGNQIPSGTEEADFSALVPPAPADRDFDLWRMLPQMNRERDFSGDLLRFIRCLQELTGIALYDIDRFPNIWNHFLAGAVWLDRMLADLGNPFNFDDLTELDKRKLIDILVEIYRSKGTSEGIVNAIRFFLGIEVEVRVPSLDTWELTAEADGATVESASVEPFALSDGETLTVIIDGGFEQTVTFNSGDFLDIGAATAEEVAAVIQTALAAGMVSEESEPFELVDGQTLVFQVDGGPDQTATFNTGDFTDISNATAAEVAAVITADIVGAGAIVDSGRVVVGTATNGAGASIHTTGGTAEGVFGFPTEKVQDGRSDPDGERVTVSSYAVGLLARVQVTGGTANDALDFPLNEVQGDAWELGVNTELAPGGTALLYSFEIVAPRVLTDQERERIEFVANYMKPAHTHLIGIVEPSAIEDVDHVELGLSDLGVNFDLH